MKFLVLIYPDPKKVDAMPAARFASTMRACLAHADQLRAGGKLLDTQMLQPAPTARTLRKKAGKLTVTDGPFAETKEVLGGFNVVEAESLDEAVKIAAEFPWTDVGSVEVRPILPVEEMRARVGA
jgi:hypothetical protein